VSHTLVPALEAESSLPGFVDAAFTRPEARGDHRDRLSVLRRGALPVQMAHRGRERLVRGARDATAMAGFQRCETKDAAVEQDLREGGPDVPAFRPRSGCQGYGEIR